MYEDKITVVGTAMRHIDAEPNQNGTSCAYWRGFLQGALMQQHEDMHGIQEQLAASILKNAKFEDSRVRYVKDKGAKTPTYAHQDDAGMDLYASILRFRRVTSERSEPRAACSATTVSFALGRLMSATRAKSW